MAKRKMCCSGGVSTVCDCCICICTKELKKVLSPKARKLLLRALS
jgi:hypothetical protein